MRTILSRGFISAFACYKYMRLHDTRSLILQSLCCVQLNMFKHTRGFTRERFWFFHYCLQEFQNRRLEKKLRKQGKLIQAAALRVQSFSSSSSSQSSSSSWSVCALTCYSCLFYKEGKCCYWATLIIIILICVCTNVLFLFVFIRKGNALRRAVCRDFPSLFYETVINAYRV